MKIRIEKKRIADLRRKRDEKIRALNANKGLTRNQKDYNIKQVKESTNRKISKVRQKEKERKAKLSQRNKEKKKAIIEKWNDSIKELRKKEKKTLSRERRIQRKKDAKKRALKKQSEKYNRQKARPSYIDLPLEMMTKKSLMPIYYVIEYYFTFENQTFVNFARIGSTKDLDFSEIHRKFMDYLDFEGIEYRPSSKSTAGSGFWGNTQYVSNEKTAKNKNHMYNADNLRSQYLHALKVDSTNKPVCFFYQVVLVQKLSESAESESVF